MENIKPTDLYFKISDLEYKTDWNSYINNLLTDPDIKKTPQIINALYQKKIVLENKKITYGDQKLLVDPLLPNIGNLRNIPEEDVLLFINNLFPPSLEELDGGRPKQKKTKTKTKTKTRKTRKTGKTRTTKPKTKTNARKRK